MESDDDYQISSHPEEPSSPIHQRKLKRLKKAVSNGATSQSIDQGKSMNVFGSPHVVDQESTKTLDIGNSVDSVRSVLGSEGFDGERDSCSKQDEIPVDRDSLDDETMVNVEEEDSLDAETEGFEFEGGGLIDLLKAEFGNSKTEKPKDTRRISEEGDEPLNIENGEGDGFGSMGYERMLNVEEEEEDSFGDLDEAAEDFDVNKGGLINELRSEIGISKKKRTKTEKKTHSSEVGGEEEHKKSKKKRGKREGTDERSEAPPAVSKRRLEKERKIYLEQLHVESQRLLRESSGVAFKPVPLVKKPISSVLEKIRQRKLEVLKMASSLSTYDDSNDSLGDTMLEQPEHYPKNDSNDSLGDTMLEQPEHYPKNDKSDEEGDDKHPKEVDKDVHTVDEVGSHLDAAHVQSLCDPASLSHENIFPNMAVDVEEVSKNAFLAQSDDIQQNILRGPQPNSEKSVQLEGQVDNPMDMQLEDLVDSPMEEAMAPSSLTMNLKLDLTSPYDIASSSSEEEDNEKENTVPHPQIPVNRELYSKGDPVKAFVDDEAEEEDDSDNDLMRFKEDEEDDDNEASEEFKDLIVTGYKEKPIDNEKRDQLHQMWLEKQDAAATDNVLQRLKCGRKEKETPFVDEDEEDEDDKEYDESGDDSADEALDHLPQKNVARINSKKAKEMMPKMFTDKDDTFLSDDEETEQKLVRQRFAEKAEEHGTFLSPADDESSREVFGLIKKLNVAPDTKKKAKPSSIFDMLISGGKSNSSSKSSFLGRATTSSSSLPPTSRKHGSSTSRSYIFGRDDSNSRTEVSTSEVSIDMVVEKDSRTIATTTRTSSASAKFISSSSSQSIKCSTQNTSRSSSSSSLLELLRRSTEKSNNKNSFTLEKNMAVGQKTQSVAQFFSAFKPGAGKKSSVIKIERRST